MSMIVLTQSFKFQQMTMSEMPSECLVPNPESYQISFMGHPVFLAKFH